MYVSIISKVQEYFTTSKWCVIDMTYKNKVIVYDKFLKNPKDIYWKDLKL
jgi:hypothetical protein